jgi:hypothetical protein
MPQMIIANRLTDGRVVFLVSPGQWDTAIGVGAVIEDETQGQGLLEAAKQDAARCLVIDPILIQVLVADGHVRPTEIREVIRAFGPTVRTDVDNASPIAGIAPEADRRADGSSRLRRTTKE